MKIEITDPVVAGLLSFVRDKVSDSGGRCVALRKASELAKLFWPPFSDPESRALRIISDCPETSSEDSVPSEKTVLQVL